MKPAKETAMNVKDNEKKKKTKLAQIPMIGPEERFYGYVVGLGVGLTHIGAKDAPYHDTNCYVMFEYNDERTIWRVPDLKLFQALGKHLNGMAYFRFEAPDDYGYDKVYISQSEEGVWSVQTP
jgi:hypothetical protein